MKIINEKIILVQEELNLLIQFSALEVSKQILLAGKTQ